MNEYYKIFLKDTVQFIEMYHVSCNRAVGVSTVANSWRTMSHVT